MSWTSEAACLGLDKTPLFFQEGKSKRSKVKTERAVSICASCPVMADCLAYALENEAYGVWGGTTEIEREVLRHTKGMPMLMPAKFIKQNPTLRALTCQSNTNEATSSNSESASSDTVTVRA